MSFAPRFTVTHPITAALTRIERARGFLEAAKLSEEWIRRMGERALVLEAHHTTHIEGTRLTLEQSERLLAGETVPEADPDDVRELLNYRRAFELVSTYLGDGGPITEGLVREIHKRLVEGVRGGSATPGEYRHVQNYVVSSATGQIVYTPPPAHDVPILMHELVEWLNDPGDIHAVLASGAAQFQLVHIHPFLDGNGRTSRLLSTLFLYRAGYDFKRLFTISEYYDRDRPSFYRAIQSVREQGMDLTGWLELFTAGLATQLDEVKARGERAIRRDILAREHRLSDRQALALGHVIEHGRLAIPDYEGLCPGTSRRTLQRDLRELVEKRLLAAQGHTNRLEYLAGEGLG
ncbi:MAG TPA: Fic family protein [Thermoanaerobaculia bacterium]|nr:Fic family protein [Thermoanaerobaculia bacterium]